MSIRNSELGFVDYQDQDAAPNLIGKVVSFPQRPFDLSRDHF
jgi:hypothetical protein